MNIWLSGFYTMQAPTFPLDNEHAILMIISVTSICWRRR